MKFIPAVILSFLNQNSVQRNMVFLRRFILLLLAMIAVCTIIFHFIMLEDGQHYSWIAGVYWTLTVMSTLGFGDITFASDLGRIFTMVVLVFGVLFLQIILPFAFIQFFYAPWLKAQEKGRTPRSLPPDTNGHVIVVSTSPIAMNLVDELRDYGAKCVILCHENQRALELLNDGYDVMLGQHDAAETYVNLRLSAAAMLVVLDSDVRNTNIIFTARDVSPSVTIVASAQSDDALDILRLAGSSRVFQFHKLLGQALARRVLNKNMRFSTVSPYKDLIVAEGPVMRTPLVGKSLKESNLRATTGANVVGLWDKGKFLLPTPDTVFTTSMVMVIVGDKKQINAANTFLKMDDGTRASDPDAPIIIIGGGRVGILAARQLAASGRNYKVVDKIPHNDIPPKNFVHGDAADLSALAQAGIKDTSSVIITTHDDDTNIYLTLYCRRLRDDVQIISRATLDRNVGILHAAGADLVLSLASMVSSSIINLLAPGKILMINEGLNIFRSPIGESLMGKSLQDSGIRAATNCSVVALQNREGVLEANPDPSHIFEEGEEIFLIGDSDSEKLFYEKFGKTLPLTS